MGCGGSIAAADPTIAEEGTEYLSSVDDKGSAVTAGFVRQVHSDRRQYLNPNTLARSSHSRRPQPERYLCPNVHLCPIAPQHDHDVTPLSSKYDTAGATILGKGAFGVVQTCKRVGTAEVFALKTITVGMLTPDELQALQNEVDILRKLDHPAIVRLFETFLDRGEVRLLAYPILS